MSSTDPHLDLDDLADHLEGLTDPPERGRIDQHLRTCDRCSALVADLQGVSSALAAEPAPAMPAAVSARIEQALGAERRDATHLDGDPVAVPLDRPRRRRAARVLLAAAAAVVVVGVGGTVLRDVGTGGADEASTAGGSADRQSAEADAPGAVRESADSYDSGGGARASDEAAPYSELELQDSAPGDAIEEATARLKTAGSQRVRATCVGQALGDPRWRGTSYAVRIGGRPGAVAFLGDLEATRELVEGILVSCGDEPRVVGRHPIRR
ncbi:MAG: zf-HC2 domain-containing protein [Nocardioidaceae bacterium]